MANNQHEDNIVDADQVDQDAPAERTTGPLRRLWPFGKRGPAPSTCAGDTSVHVVEEEEEDTDDFRRRRKLIESFSEDYLSWTDKAKLSTANAVGFLLPVAAVLAVGTDIGKFFTPALGAFSSYVLAYSIEAGIAALTIRLGMAAQKTNETRDHWVRVAIAAVVWFIATVASGLTMYVIALVASPPSVAQTWLGGASIAARTLAVALMDLLSVCILFWKGKTLQKFLHEQSLTTHATLEVNEAELAIKRAQETAAMRRKEDEQYLQSKQRQFEVVAELTEMTNQALLDVARRNLLKAPDEGNNRRMNRY